MSLSPVKDLVPYTHKTKQFASSTSLLLYAWNLPNLVQKSDIQKRSLKGRVLFQSTMRCIKSLKKICNLNELSDILSGFWWASLWRFGLSCKKKWIIDNTNCVAVNLWIYGRGVCISSMMMHSTVVNVFVGIYWLAIGAWRRWQRQNQNQNKERSLWRPGIPGNTLYFVEDTKRYRIFSEFSLWCTPRPRLGTYMYA